MKKQYFASILSAIGMGILILDTKTAITGMTDGITICLQTLIPSLFPFLLLSMLLTSFLLGRKIPLLHSIGKILGIPSGAESILAVGLLGGYPVGAQSIAQAVHNGNISRENGQRMLAFCSNAGPAFLFGLGVRLFPAVWYCWLLWAIHIVSALLVGWLMRPRSTGNVCITNSVPTSLPTALRRSIQTMAQICGFVVIFRVILAFCQNWFLWLLPHGVQVLFCGVLELANGCCALAQIPSVATRFTLFSVFIGFGGLCVLMQTQSVCDGLPISHYLAGKILQTIISFFLCITFISREMRIAGIAGLFLVYVGYSIFTGKPQKKLAFFRKSVYN